MPAYDLHVNGSGPIIEGRAPEIVRQFMADATLRVAQTGQDWIRLDADAMDRSGRGGTGRAAAGVLLKGGGDQRVIWGDMVKGEVWWPWLEGVSKRNATTRFGGYHTFRKTRQRLEQHLAEILRPLVDEMIRRLDGG